MRLHFIRYLLLGMYIIFNQYLIHRLDADIYIYIAGIFHNHLIRHNEQNCVGHAYSVYRHIFELS